MSEKTQVGFVVNRDLQSLIKAKCKKEERKFSEIVRLLLRKWVDGTVHV